MKTKYFTLDEMLVSAKGQKLGIKNVLPDNKRAAMLNTMEQMDRVRELLGHPVIVLSGYRSPELNKAVGGSERSWHSYGQAVDFICPKFGSPLEICKFLHAAAMKDITFRYHELIHEYGTWVHLAFPLKGQRADMELLTIDKRGTRRGL